MTPSIAYRRYSYAELPWFPFSEEWYEEHVESRLELREEPEYISCKIWKEGADGKRHSVRDGYPLVKVYAKDIPPEYRPPDLDPRASWTPQLDTLAWERHNRQKVGIDVVTGQPFRLDHTCHIPANAPPGDLAHDSFRCSAISSEDCLHRLCGEGTHTRPSTAAQNGHPSRRRPVVVGGGKGARNGSKPTTETIDKAAERKAKKYEEAEERRERIQAQVDLLRSPAVSINTDPLVRMLREELEVLTYIPDDVNECLYLVRSDPNVPLDEKNLATLNVFHSVRTKLQETKAKVKSGDGVASLAPGKTAKELEAAREKYWPESKRAEWEPLLQPPEVKGEDGLPLPSSDGEGPSEESGF